VAATTTTIEALLNQQERKSPGSMDAAPGKVAHLRIANAAERR
jgi:hypothetical protein